MQLLHAHLVAAHFVGARAGRYFPVLSEFLPARSIPRVILPFLPFIRTAQVVKQVRLRVSDKFKQFLRSDLCHISSIASHSFADCLLFQRPIRIFADLLYGVPAVLGFRNSHSTFANLLSSFSCEIDLLCNVDG